ncbi:MAG: YceD family protein [Pseudomonadota bacterium]
MRISLFDRLSYERLGERRAGFELNVTLDRCERLREVGAAEDEVTLHVDAEPHAHGVRLCGRVSGEVSVSCCRCLRPVAIEVDRDIDLVVVGTEAAMDALPDTADVHYAPDLMGRLVDILEEEVLLALPDFPSHQDCEPPVLPGGVDVQAPREGEAREQKETQRPFATALAGMGRTEDNQTE